MKCPHDGHECFHQCQEFGCERAKGKLTKHAQVGNTVFHAGVEEHMVIERAQREYEYHQSPEREAERKRSLEEFRISIYDYSLEMRDKPIAMLLWCPKCAMRHIDEGEFGTKEHHTRMRASNVGWCGGPRSLIRSACSSFLDSRTNLLARLAGIH